MMVTKRTYFCNVCRDEVDSLCAVGFEFKSGGEELQENNGVAGVENHLCYRCIGAIYALSVRLFPYNTGQQDL